MYAKYGKRTLDLLCATLALAALALPLLLVALWVRLDSRGPALFRQKRYGQHKRPFQVYKFRTMATDAPSDRATSDFHDSHNFITRSGKIMRKLSIDELPQIINVLKSEMSIVGPRPVVLSEKGLIKLRDRNGANKLKPGVTGWAQVNGRDELDDVAKAEMDGEYAKNISFITDVKCMFKTVWILVSAAGHAEGHEQAAQKDEQALAQES